MARWVKRLEPAQTRLLVGVLLCAAFFIASTDEEEWCSACNPHAAGKLTVVNNDPELVKVTLLGPRRMDITVPSRQTKTVTIRVGVYYYAPMFWNLREREWLPVVGANIFVSPDRPNIITFGESK